MGTQNGSPSNWVVIILYPQKVPYTWDPWALWRGSLSPLPGIPELCEEVVIVAAKAGQQAGGGLGRVHGDPGGGQLRVDSSAASTSSLQVASGLF